jgi:hypothetical protein
MWYLIPKTADGTKNWLYFNGSALFVPSGELAKKKTIWEELVTSKIWDSHCGEDDTMIWWSAVMWRHVESKQIAKFRRKMLSPCSSPDDGDSMFLRNTGTYLWIHKPSQPSRTACYEIYFILHSKASWTCNFFVYFWFNDVGSASEFVVWNGRTINKQWVRKDVDRSGRDLI